MAIKKKYQKGGNLMGKQTTRKKQMGGVVPPQQGVVSPRPAASFIEPPMEQPFEKSSFVAQRGGVRKLRKEQIEERRDKRRTDRQADRQAIRTLKKSSRLKRRDKIDDEGKDIRMSRDDRRTDRRATNKASRTFRRQERKARRTTNKADKLVDRGERQTLRATNKKKKQDAIDAKLNILNKSESSSVKTTPPAVVEKTNNNVVEEQKKETKKVESIVNDKMSFSQAYRAQRNANKASKTGHTDKKGNFTWRGKSYNTESRSEKTKRLTMLPEVTVKGKLGGMRSVMRRKR